MSFFTRRKIKSQNIIKKINEKDKLVRYFFLVIGCFLIAISFNMFFEPNNLIAGGVSGLSIIVSNAIGLDSSIFITVTYLLLIILSFAVLGKEQTKYSIIGSILYPVFVVLTKDISKYVEFDVNNMLLIALFGSFLQGIGSGVTFKYGFSTGGSDIICQIISKYFKISIGNAIKYLNLIIIIIGGFYTSTNGSLFAWENVMYGIIIVYIISLLNDKVLLGISNSKSFFVITEYEDEIKSFLLKELNMGVTVLEARGGYTGKKQKVLMCAIPTKLYFSVKEGILEIDKDAIILINDVYQSSGIE